MAVFIIDKTAALLIDLKHLVMRPVPPWCSSQGQHGSDRQCAITARAFNSPRLYRRNA